MVGRPHIHLAGRIPNGQHSATDRVHRDLSDAVRRHPAVHGPGRPLHAAHLLPLPDAALLVAPQPAHAQHVPRTAQRHREVRQLAVDAGRPPQRRARRRRVHREVGAPTAGRAAASAVRVRAATEG